MKHQNFKRDRHFHFTTKFVHPKFYDQTQSQNWEDFRQTLKDVQTLRSDLTLTWYSGVLMSNHVHLLFSTDEFNEHSLVLDIEKCWQKILKVRAPLFQRPLPCEPIDNFEHFKQAYKYIYRNPVEAGLAPRAESYPYSSLPLILDRSKCRHPQPFVDPMEIIFDPFRRLRWLNQPDQTSRILLDHGPEF